MSTNLIFDINPSRGRKSGRFDAGQVQRAVPEDSRNAGNGELMVSRRCVMTHIVGVGVTVRAAVLEIRVTGDSGRWARRRGSVTTRTTIARVLLVAIQIGRAGTQAPHCGSGGVEWSLQRSRAVWCWIIINQLILSYTPANGKVLTEINRTVSDRTANVGDSHGQIVPVDETDIVPI